MGPECEGKSIEQTKLRWIDRETDHYVILCNYIYTTQQNNIYHLFVCSSCLFIPLRCSLGKFPHCGVNEGLLLNLP